MLTSECLIVCVLFFSTKSHVQITYLTSILLHHCTLRLVSTLTMLKTHEGCLLNSQRNSWTFEPGHFALMHRVHLISQQVFSPCIFSAVGQWSVWSSYWSEAQTQTTKTSLDVPHSIWQQEMGRVFLKFIHYCHLLAIIHSLCQPHCTAWLETWLSANGLD